MKEKKHNTGLNVPEGYFDTFEDRMMIKVMEENLPKSNGFKVPEGYFKQFEVSPSLNVDTTTQPAVISIFRKKTLLYVSGVAASLLLIISLVNTKNDNLSMESLSADTVEAYINDGVADIDAYDVLALLSEEELESISIPSEVVSEENLEAYLIENLDETSLLIE
ncbi:MAG: hypothetical protein DWP94_11410 [Flavobacterium sp.]|nr:MAG: hypothetical protein DWP94_11410 [Flavobacterium sp.]